MVLRNFTDIVQMGSSSSSFQTSDKGSEGDFRHETRPGKLFSTAPEPLPERRRQRIVLSPGLRSVPAPVYVVSNAAPWPLAKGGTLSDDASVALYGASAPFISQCASPVTPVMPQCAAVAPGMAVGSRRVLSCTVLPAREAQATGEAFKPYDPFASRVQRITSKGNYHMAWLRSMARWELDSIERIIASYGEEPAARIVSAPDNTLESCLKKRGGKPKRSGTKSLHTVCLSYLKSWFMKTRLPIFRVVDNL